MRSNQEILERLRELCQRRLRERKSKYLCKCQLNCIYNKRHRVKGTGSVGFCHNEEVTRHNRRFVFVCNDEQTAKSCTFFQCANTEESVQKDFERIIREPSRCGSEYPKLAMLIWVLQADGKQLSEKEKRLKRLKEVFQNCLRNLKSLFTFRWW